MKSLVSLLFGLAVFSFALYVHFWAVYVTLFYLFYQELEEYAGDLLALM